MKDHTHTPNNNSCRSNIVPTLTRGTSAEIFLVLIFWGLLFYFFFFSFFEDGGSEGVD